MTFEEYEAQATKKPPVMSDVVREYIIEHAKAVHGLKSYEKRVAIAKELETLSDNARSADLQAILSKHGDFCKASARFDMAYSFLGCLFIKAVAPRALDYDGFVMECSKRVRQVTVPALLCPFCDGDMRLDGHTIKISSQHVEESIYCETCRYSESVEIAFGPAGPAGPAGPDKDKDVEKLADVIVRRFFDEKARHFFGEHEQTYRKFAKMLERMSGHAKAKRFSQLVNDKRGIQDAWDLYERAYNAVGKRFMPAFAPDALTPESFIRACSQEEIIGTMQAITCPCCDGRTFEDNDACPPFVTENEHLMVSLFCLTCGFPLDIILNFQQNSPQGEQESMISAYIRSLLAYEGYSKDHGLGAHHERQVLASVAEQTAKAFVHLPDGLSLDYQQLVKLEMTR